MLELRPANRGEVRRCLQKRSLGPDTLQGNNIHSIFPDLPRRDSLSEMAASMKDDDFHPDDPTKWLWKKLLRSKPVPYDRKPKTKRDRRRIALKVQQYYIDRKHPRKGKPFGG